jgi:tripartite-type tricarboxylate transporter receptor subunit TctC
MKTSLRQVTKPQHPSQPRRNNGPRKIPSSGQHPRRQFLRLAAGAAAFPAVSRVASAQSYPLRPITVIVPAAAGGPLDAVARVVSERMRTLLGQPMVIENVSGADGSIGTGRAARAKPDGYTISLLTGAYSVLNGAFYSLQYDVLHDLAPVSPVVKTPFVLYARKSIPAKDMDELIAWLKARPNKASVGIDNVGTRLMTAFFQKETHTQLTLVPYRGGAPAMQDIVAGQIDLFFNPPSHLPLVRAGLAKAYAVSGDLRSALAPDLPIFGEVGLPAVSYFSWDGLFAPKSTPTAIIGVLDAALVTALADAPVRTRLAELGYEVFPSAQQTPEALAALQKADAEKWWPIMKELGLRAE